MSSELFYTIEVLDETISRSCQISFTQNSYGTARKFHLRSNQQITVNPYHTATTNGRYYLIGSDDTHDGLKNHSVDRITGSHLLDTKGKLVRQVAVIENRLYLAQYMAGHLYMFTDESVVVPFRIKIYPKRHHQLVWRRHCLLRRN